MKMHLLTYFVSVGEILVILTPKEFDRVVHKGKQFKWEGNSFLKVWMDGWVLVMFHPK
jgi:hypothetical protein